MTARAAFGTLLAVALAAPAARGDAAGALAATASCERRATKGRVVCDVEVESADARIAWADVLVVAAPPFAPPLRSRVGVAEARVRTDRRVRIPVALLATGLGKGKLVVRARAVLCRAREAARESCVPEASEAAAELVVGAEVER